MHGRDGCFQRKPGGPLRRATAVASRDGDLVAYDAGEVFEHTGHVPTSRLEHVMGLLATR